MKMKIYILIRQDCDWDWIESHVVKVSKNKESLENLEKQIDLNWRKALQQYEKDFEKLSKDIKCLLDENLDKIIQTQTLDTKLISNLLAQNWEKASIDGVVGVAGFGPKVDRSVYSHLKPVKRPKESNNMCKSFHLSIHEAELD